jgi:hypothetical protein
MGLVGLEKEVESLLSFCCFRKEAAFFFVDWASFIRRGMSTWAKCAFSRWTVIFGTLVGEIFFSTFDAARLV